MRSKRAQQDCSTRRASARPPLRKSPTTSTTTTSARACGTTQHRHKITDWEVGALFWNCSAAMAMTGRNHFATRSSRICRAKIYCS
jgi:hypothetical protein